MSLTLTDHIFPNSSSRRNYYFFYYCTTMIKRPSYIYVLSERFFKMSEQGHPYLKGLGHEMIIFEGQ
jgi:hypothetical protein